MAGGSPFLLNGACFRRHRATSRKSTPRKKAGLKLLPVHFVFPVPQFVLGLPPLAWPRGAALHAMNQRRRAGPHGHAAGLTPAPLPPSRAANTRPRNGGRGACPAGGPPPPFPLPPAHAPSGLRPSATRGKPWGSAPTPAGAVGPRPRHENQAARRFLSSSRAAKDAG
jgi:hypothetical protein